MSTMLPPFSPIVSADSKIKHNAPNSPASGAGTGNPTQDAPLATPVTVPPATTLVYFGLSTNTKRAYAKRVINQLEAMKAKPQLEDADQQTLDKFGKLYNNIPSANMEVGEGKEKQTVDALSTESLNNLPKEQRQAVLDSLQRALKARLGATGYTPPSQMVGRESYIVHNTFVQKELKPTYSSKDIQSIRSLLEEKKVFRVHTNPSTGLIQTSETANQQMLRQWFTDSCMMGMLQRDKEPNNWQKVMLVSAAALNTEAATEAVDEAVKNPDWYRKQNDEKDSDYHMRGVFHIYQPESVHFDPKTGIPVVEDICRDANWFNQKRLESQALVLSNLVDTLQAGAAGKPWGFSPEFMASPERSKLITNAVVNMARYLMAINTNPETNKFDFAAPSASSWEETPFPGGMTSDTGMTVVAFEKLHDLLFNPQYDNNEPIQQIRQAVSQTPLRNKEVVEQFIQQGRNKVAKRITEPLKAGKEPMQNPARKPDTSLTLLAASDYRFHPGNLVEDARTRLQLVQAMKSLSGDYGMRRYNEFELNGAELHDSYLNTNYHIPGPLREALDSAGQKSKGDFGSGDASGEKAMQDRQALSSPKNAAQWGLGVSASLQALARAKSDLLHHIQGQDQPANQDELELLQNINKELHHFTTWNLALISGPLDGKTPVTRADGSPCPENSVMESYEVVTDLNGIQKRVPGAHTLPWGSAQLYDGLKRAQAAHMLEEKLKATGRLSAAL